jgi:GNAT superfamily N-acetyltransferase
MTTKICSDWSNQALMPLKLELITDAIAEMAAGLTIDQTWDRLQAARAEYVTQDAAHIRRRLEDRAARPGWLVAYPVAALAGAVDLPGMPASYCVAAADGSSINPDRHSPVRFYLINTGYAVLTYGAHPDAELDSTCRLYHRDEEVYVEPRHQTLPIDGALLAVQMAVAELEALSQATTLVGEPEVVALRDGTLILWGLDSPGLSEATRERFLGPYRAALEDFQSRRIPLASYISFPGGDELVNALRVGMCPDTHVVCNRCETLRQLGTPHCGGLVPLEDRQLLAGLLRPGQRSALFKSQQPVLRFYNNPAQHVLFFYVNVGSEIARVEVPQWVADDPDLLDRVHAVVVDQCQRGNGFPPALVEAHEQAVINLGDRALVERMLEEALAQRGIVYTRSMKDRTKRERSI